MGLNGGSRIRGGFWGLFIVGLLSVKYKGLCLFCRSDVVILKGGVVDWDEGMGELYYTNDGCLFFVLDVGSCGRKFIGFVGEWVVVYMYIF